jgi:tetratricopeptide (TPR) repeat protein
LEGPVAQDSPLFQLFEAYPGVDMSHQVTDVFRNRAEYSEKLRTRLAAAKSEGVEGLRTVEAELGDLRAVERGVLMDLYLSYRDVEDGFPEMVRLYEEFPSELRESVVAKQQLALALNRRGEPGDVERAVQLLDVLLEESGGSAETYGILGRIHKDRYRAAREAGDGLMAEGALDEAIAAYTRGFEIEPADYYPGVNAVNLLVQKGTDEAQLEADRLVPLVTFAAVRKGGGESSDYWTVATVLELALIGRDEGLARRVLPRLVSVKSEPWMLETTADNLEMVMNLRKDSEPTDTLETTIAELRSRAAS